MQTRFTLEQLRDPAMARSEGILKRCLQCAYCLPNCPTHQLLDDEKDSPKGRVRLIKDMLEQGGVPDDDTVLHIDRCLSCLACLSSCPSFVNYMHLVDHARESIEENYQRPFQERIARWALAKVLPYPGRFRLAVSSARLARPMAKLMPGPFRRMLEMAPPSLPPFGTRDSPQVFPAEGQRERRVALLTGCAQRVLDPGINDATISILRRHGCEVVVARGAGCCGALTHHMGKTKDSHALAARNIQAWMKEYNGEGLDAIVINTSGCGTVVKDYEHMFTNHELAGDAATISGLAKDISELLSDLDLHFIHKPGMRVAYHATCSLQFGQRIRYLPRKLLKLAGFVILEPRDSHVCCGAAATYHILQPELAAQLQQRKVRALEDEKPDAIVAGNIGCMNHIGSATSLPVVHTVELLDWATGGKTPQVLEGKPGVASSQPG